MRNVANTMRRWEQRLVWLINSRISSARLDVPMRLLSGLGSAWTALGLCLVLWFLPGHRSQAAALSIAVTGSHLLVQAMKRFFKRSRPYGKLVAVRTITARLADGSFPSGHTTAAFSIAGVFAVTTSLAATPLWTLAALTGLSRVYLGHHYPTDVLAGAAIGISFAALAAGIVI